MATSTEAKPDPGAMERAEADMKGKAQASVSIRSGTDFILEDAFQNEMLDMLS